MPITPPLQVSIYRHSEDLDTAEYEKALLQAFQGGEESLGYVAGGEDLNIPLRVFHQAPEVEQTAPDFLDSVPHSVTIVLLDRRLLSQGGEALWNWLAACWEHTRSSEGRHYMLVVAFDERVSSQLIDSNPAFATHQILVIHQLGERAMRKAVLALRVLHECRVLLARAVQLNPLAGHPVGYLRLFISHAKLDGLPLAHSLRHLIHRFNWLQDFYDAEDLPAGCDWQQELEASVGSSLIVMLRTELYDQRYWCQREVLWSEEYATPAVLVDARTKLHHPGGGLPLDRVPTVRIPDGNLMRVLFVAIREGLRFLLFARAVNEMKNVGDIPNPVQLHIFSYAPGMSALLRACAVMNANAPAAETRRLIIYPDPPLRAGIYEAAVSLVQAYAPGIELVTPNALVVGP